MTRHGVIIQARMGSSRFPGKVLQSLGGNTILVRVVSRCMQACDKVVVATTTKMEDGVICKLCSDYGVPWHTGSEHDVLQRMIRTARSHDIDRIVRVNADCPLIEPHRISELIECDAMTQYRFDYLAYTVNGVPAITKHVALPELVTLDALQLMDTHAKFMREHVTWGCHSGLRLNSHLIPFDGDQDRNWTVDDPGDIARLEALCQCELSNSARSS